MVRRRPMMRHIFTRENAIVCGLCALILALVIVTIDSAPTWIYQGF